MNRSLVFVCAMSAVAACGGGEAPGTGEVDSSLATGTVVCRGRSTLGKSCDDGNPCTSGDKCTMTGCVGTPYTCDDGNVCTSDRCDGRGGCVFTPTTGGACNDGNACTFGDTCRSGACVGTAYSCGSANSCISGVCDGNGGCTQHVNGGAACNDGIACTHPDICGGDGACYGLRPPEICDNGIDDDCDGLVDAADPDCAPSCSSRMEICDNGIDDDCDGLIDAADPDCNGCVRTSATENCSTPEDDDCDGLVNGDDYYDCIDCFANECGSGTVCDQGGWCVSSCHDGYQDSDESDVDCGGGCPRCADGKKCWGFWDCLSYNCVNGVCTPYP